MQHRIERVVVIGAGTMGGGIAALIASVGLSVTLLDMPATELTADEQARGLELDAPEVRNRIVNNLWQRQLNARPPALVTPDAARLVTLGNLADDLDIVREADWIVEAIVEQLAPKQQLMARIDGLRQPSAIVSSNTSGIPIREIAAGRSASFRQHFLGTHFFNPPRYLKLLEIIPTPDTQPDVVQTMRDVGSQTLGKGVVIAKDRPNFIANRIGALMAQVRLRYALDHGYTVEEVDALTGPLIGNPKTATFRLKDLVGLDTSAHVTRNLYAAVPDDECREQLQLPPILERLLREQRLGNKTGAGFYKKVHDANGSQFYALNLETGEYEPPHDVRFALVEQVREIADLGERLRTIFERGQGDRAGDYIINTMLPMLAYSARRIPEIADALLDIDNAMRWGFNVELGPFELWDALGVHAAAELMRHKQIAVAPWVDQMLHQGIGSFYLREGGQATGVYDPATKRIVDI